MNLGLLNSAQLKYKYLLLYHYITKLSGLFLINDVHYRSKLLLLIQMQTFKFSKFEVNFKIKQNIDIIYENIKYKNQ